jgi:hypothetical protein
MFSEDIYIDILSSIIIDRKTIIVGFSYMGEDNHQIHLAWQEPL